MSNLARTMGALMAVTLLGCTQSSKEQGGAPGNGGSAVNGGDSGSGGGATGSGGTPTASGTAGSSGLGGLTTIPGALSGSRLKPYLATAPDGPQQFMGIWRDTQLNVDCLFGVAPDGQYRCVPWTMGGDFYFSDAGCSNGLGAYSSCASSTLPNYISSSPTSGSGCSATTTTTIYLRGAPYTGTVYSGTPASCSALTSTATAGTAFYSLGALVDVTIFQSASYGYQ